MKMKKFFGRQVTIDFNQAALLNCIIQDVADADGIVPDGLVDEVDDEEEIASQFQTIVKMLS